MKKILIVTALYYPEISANLKNGATNFLKANGHEIKMIDVPGIFEIPSVVAKYIDKFDGVVVLGCVIKGETSHFDLISRSVTESIMNLSISYKKPIGNGLISCLNKKQALERSNLQNKLKNKGVEAAKAVSLVLNREPVDFKSS
tara:strand:- start:891 stop:1322 length:432 start_codon:yes stop_codon:yes gene_type:complete